MTGEVEARVARGGLSTPALVGFGFLVAAGGLAALGHDVRLIDGLAWVVIGIATLGVLAVRGPQKPNAKVRRVSTSADGLRIDGKLALRKSRILRAHVGARTEDGFPVFVEARAPFRTYAAYAPTKAEAEALCAGLETRRWEDMETFRALPPWAHRLQWLFVILTISPWFLFNMVKLLPSSGVPLLVLAYALIAVPVVLPQHVRVGADGVFLRWLGRGRFLPFTKIEKARATTLGLELVLTSGAVKEIRLRQRAEPTMIDRDVLLARIGEGIAAKAHGLRADEEALLARGARDLETWFRDVHGGGERRGYRALTVPRERLWQIVESPTADPSAREGAALALHAELEEDERARLVAIAARTASPRLRVAFEGAANEREPERLRVALEQADEIELEENDDARVTRSARSSRR